MGKTLTMLEFQMSYLHKHYKAQFHCIFLNRLSSKSCTKVWLQVQNALWSLDEFSPTGVWPEVLSFKTRHCFFLDNEYSIAHLLQKKIGGWEETLSLIRPLAAQQERNAPAYPLTSDQRGPNLGSAGTCVTSHLSHFHDSNYASTLPLPSPFLNLHDTSHSDLTPLATTLNFLFLLITFSYLKLPVTDI